MKNFPSLSKITGSSKSESAATNIIVANAPSDGDHIDWGRYLDIIRLRLWMILGITTITMVVVGLYTLRIPKEYSATSTVVIETSTPKVLTGVQEVMDVGNGGWVPDSFYETEYQVMRSRAIARRAGEKLGILRNDTLVGLDAVSNPQEREEKRKHLDPADYVLGRYTITPDSKTNAVVRISVIHKNPAFTAALANAVAESYEEANLEKKIGGSRDASSWLSVQAIDLKNKLERSEDALQQFMIDNDVLNASLESQLEEVRQRLEQFNENLAHVQADRIRSTVDSKALNEVRNNAELLDSLPEVQEASVIKALKERLIELTSLQTELLARYQEAHPKVRAVEEQLSTVRVNLNKELRALILSLERKQESLSSTEQGLKKAIAEERQREARLNHLSLDYRRLRRDVETNEKLYSLVQNRMKEANITSEMRFNNVRILDRAIEPSAPFRPSLKTNLLAALMLGLFLGIALTVLLDLLDTTIKSQEDIEQYLNVPFLGLLPVIHTVNSDSARSRTERLAAAQERDLYVLKNPHSTAAECARFVRTNLLYMSPDEKLHTLVVTSPSPQEGKTTSAITFATIMAQAGTKTLLVDMDMRRPRIHRSFGLSNEIGISSLIVGEAVLDEAIQHTEEKNLDVLVCGPLPPQPAELIHTASFKRVFEQLKEHYQLVIFDAPPVGPVADPVVLGTIVDAVILIVKCESTTKDLAKQVIRALQDAKVRVLGAVLNDVDISEKRYSRVYYAYYRRYGDYQSGTKEKRLSVSAS
jgi:succinoglycan biosynthesis transport protein ExoP